MAGRSHNQDVQTRRSDSLESLEAMERNMNNNLIVVKRKSRLRLMLRNSMSSKVTVFMTKNYVTKTYVRELQVLCILIETINLVCSGMIDLC